MVELMIEEGWKVDVMYNTFAVLLCTGDRLSCVRQKTNALSQRDVLQIRSPVIGADLLISGW